MDNIEHDHLVKIANQFGKTKMAMDYLEDLKKLSKEDRIEIAKKVYDRWDLGYA